MKEIEVKYLIENNNGLKEFIQNNEVLSIKRIEQTYLSINGTEEVRIRSSIDKESKDDRFTLTYKSDGDFIRDEIEITINAQTYHSLFQLKSYDPTIIKHRYSVKVDNYVIEIDFYKNDLEDLIIAEVELKSEDDRNNLEFISNFPFVVKDITADKKYKNKNLWKSII